MPPLTPREIKRRAKMRTEHLAERPRYYAELHDAMAVPTGVPEIDGDALAIAAEPMQKAEHAWERGPRGGTRRKVGDKWRYKGGGGKGGGMAKKEEPDHDAATHDPDAAKGKGFVAEPGEGGDDPAAEVIAEIQAKTAQLTDFVKQAVSKLGGGKGGEEGAQKAPGAAEGEEGAEPQGKGPEGQEGAAGGPEGGESAEGKPGEGADGPPGKGDASGEDTPGEAPAPKSKAEEAHEQHSKGKPERTQLPAADVVEQQGKELVEQLEKEGHTEAAREVRSAIAHVVAGLRARQNGKATPEQQQNLVEWLKEFARAFNASAAPASVLGPDLAGLLAPAAQHEAAQKAAAEEQAKAAGKGPKKPGTSGTPAPDQDAAKQARDVPKSDGTPAQESPEPQGERPPSPPVKKPMAKGRGSGGPRLILPASKLRKARSPYAASAGHAPGVMGPQPPRRSVPDYEAIWGLPQGDEEDREREQEANENRRKADADRDVYSFHGVAEYQHEPTLRYVPPFDKVRSMKGGNKSSKKKRDRTRFVRDGDAE